MKNQQSRFIEFAIRNKVLQFGDFKLKSGRQSPYFFNAGLFYEGESLRTLGEFFAELYLQNHIKTTQLFGPAYKGILLATTTSMALASHGRATTVTFNRKEVKDHGEGGILMGAPLTGPVTLIDDVITAGTAFREAQGLIKHYGQVPIDSVLIALDRCERGQHATSCIDEIRAQGIQVHSLINLFDIVAYLNQAGRAREAEAMLHYQKKYAPQPCA